MSKQPSLQEAHRPEGAIFTIGHSTLPIGSFPTLLHTYGIAGLADIRTVPRSSRGSAAKTAPEPGTSPATSP